MQVNGKRTPFKGRSGENSNGWQGSFHRIYPNFGPVYSVLRPLLFAFPAEKAHRLTFAATRWGGAIPGVRGLWRARYQVRSSELAVEAFGVRFPNPIGLAAGMDKNGELLHRWGDFGFGHVEVGTVTPLPQPGNPKPRLFRLKPDGALINRMGFNNAGMEALARRLEKRPANLVVGVNIGKNKATPNETAHQDYLRCFERLQELGDYFVVNVSSPNTPGLRDLQSEAALERILGEVQDRNTARSQPKPLLLKLAPDLTDPQLEALIPLIRKNQLAGVVATNTTIARPTDLKTSVPVLESIGSGGLSGQPLQARSTEVVRLLAAAGIPVIGVGGIHDAASAQEKFAAGAHVVQVYTGLVFRGPGLVREILAAEAARKKATRQGAEA